ncbi:MAG TPA: hypothetical protein VGR70_06890 [Stellaceae bacterium]|nr:hypothetical protein [Stellaceae bacterium]
MDDGFVRQHGQVVAFPLAEQGSRNWGDDVERFNQYPLYELGKALQKLDARRGDDQQARYF